MLCLRIGKLVTIKRIKIIFSKTTNIKKMKIMEKTLINIIKKMMILRMKNSVRMYTIHVLTTLMP